MSDTKKETIKKANTKKAAMKKVGNEIPEFGVKNREAGSKARGTQKAGLDKPKTNSTVKESTRKSTPPKAGSSSGSNPYGKRKSF